MLYKYTAMKCTITRTHSKGRLLSDRDYESPVDGPIQMWTKRHVELRRDIKVLTVKRRGGSGVDVAGPIPDLYEPEWVTFMSERGAMMVTGWEEIDGQRFYQGWYVRFE